MSFKQSIKTGLHRIDVLLAKGKYVMALALMVSLLLHFVQFRNIQEYREPLELHLYNRLTEFYRYASADPSLTSVDSILEGILEDRAADFHQLEHLLNYFGSLKSAAESLLYWPVSRLWGIDQQNDIALVAIKLSFNLHGSYRSYLDEGIPLSEKRELTERQLEHLNLFKRLLEDWKVAVQRDDLFERIKEERFRHGTDVFHFRKELGEMFREMLDITAEYNRMIEYRYN